MPKRLTVTGKWGEPWFMKLSPQAKLIFLYMLDNCDYIGIYEYNEELLRVQIGFSSKVEIRNHIKELEEKVEWFNDGVKIWIVNFIKVQYGVLKDKSSIHKTVLRELIKYRENEKSGIKLSCYLKAVNQLFISVCLENDVGYVYPNGNGNGKKKIEKGLLGEKLFSIPTQQQVHEVMSLISDKTLDAGYESQQFINFYESKGWLVGNQKMKDWRPSAQKWINEKMKNVNSQQPVSTSRSAAEIIKEKENYMK